MWAWIISALGYLVNWLFRASIMKFVIFAMLSAVLLVVVEAAIDLLELGNVAVIEDFLAYFPADILFYMGLFRLEVGIPLILAAMLARFTIRRLPIIG